MAKLFILLVFSVSTFALGKSPLETFDLSPEERDAVIDYCAPTGELIEVIFENGTKITRHSYNSDRMGLTEEDIPPYDLLSSQAILGSDLRSQKAKAFLALMVDAVDPKDGCDRVAVLYFAKFIAHYWPGTKGSGESELNAEVAKDFLQREMSPLLRNARIEARKMLLKP
jgi:hypothetical protein